jgi:hypothetical protein
MKWHPQTGKFSGYNQNGNFQSCETGRVSSYSAYGKEEYVVYIVLRYGKTTSWTVEATSKK